MNRREFLLGSTALAAVLALPAMPHVPTEAVAVEPDVIRWRLALTMDPNGNFRIKKETDLGFEEWVFAKAGDNRRKLDLNPNL